MKYSRLLPVRGGSEAAHLVGDGGAVLALPLPETSLIGEGLASERLAVGAFAGKLPLHHEVLAMPAWSVPGAQREVWPLMRCQRVRMSHLRLG